MSIQKSKKEYVGAPLGTRLSEAPLPNHSQPKSEEKVADNSNGGNSLIISFPSPQNNLEQCLWKHTGECAKSMPELYAKCKGTCFAYIPYKKPEGDYQI